MKRNPLKNTEPMKSKFPYLKLTLAEKNMLKRMYNKTASRNLVARQVVFKKTSRENTTAVNLDKKGLGEYVGVGLYSSVLYLTPKGFKVAMNLK